MTTFKSFIKEWGITLVIIATILLTRLFLWNPVTVDGHSMDPTLADKERLIMISMTQIERFDIVVAVEEGADGKQTKIVKRVIGMPGDILNFDNDTLYINGVKTEEPYLNEYIAAFQKDKLQETYSYNSYFQELAQRANAFTLNSQGQTTFSIEVPEGEYFLMGDDRLVSKDSRQVGAFPQEAIIGEIKFRMWPLKHIRFF